MAGEKRCGKGEDKKEFALTLPLRYDSLALTFHCSYTFFKRCAFFLFLLELILGFLEFCVGRLQLLIERS